MWCGRLGRVGNRWWRRCEGVFISCFCGGRGGGGQERMR